MCRYHPDGQVFSDALFNQPVSTPDAAARHAGASFDAGSCEGRCRQQQTPMQHAANADAGCCVFICRFCVFVFLCFCLFLLVRDILFSAFVFLLIDFGDVIEVGQCYYNVSHMKFIICMCVV